MKKLRENAERTREVLKREQTPLSKQCEAVVLSDLKKVLNGYFLIKNVEFSVEKGDVYTIKIIATASEIKPFGVIRY